MAREKKTLTIGMVAHDGRTFWRIVGWVGKRSAAIREVKPVYRVVSRASWSSQYYSFRAVDKYLKVKSLDWYWENCKVKSFQEIQEMEKTNDSIKTAKNI